MKSCFFICHRSVPPEMRAKLEATVPRQFAIARANRIVLRCVDYLICYDAGHIGHTRELVENARRRERKGLIHIENLAE